MRSLTPADDLPVLDTCTWLYTGAEGPPLRVQQAALERYHLNRAMGEAGRRAHAEVELSLRKRLERSLGLRGGDVALLSNASEAMNLVARSLDLQPGDNVVVNDLEFPSVVQPWLKLRESGVEVRVARHDGVSIPPEVIDALIDERTRVVALGHVSYMSGWRHDIAAVSDAASRVNALVLLDVTQSFGVVEVPSALVDVVVSSSYKWLMGGHGIGILGWNRARRPLPQPGAVGWRSVAELFTDDRFVRYSLHDDARRFEVGYPSFPSIYLLECSLGWLANFDIGAIQEHVLALSGRLVDEFLKRRWISLTSEDPQRRAGNVSICAPRGAELAEALAARNIFCWGGDGRLRVSVHLFNDDADIDVLLEALDEMPPRIRPATAAP